MSEQQQLEIEQATPAPETTAELTPCVEPLPISEDEEEAESLAQLSARILELEQQLSFRPPATLAERLCAVRARLTAPVPKRGQMIVFGQQIEYVKHDDLCEHIRVHMAAEGVDFRPCLEPDRPITEMVRQTNRGTRTEYRVWVRMSLVAGQEREEFWWVGEGASIPIATTFAVKYFLLKLLVLAGGEDSDEAAGEEASALKPEPKIAPPKTSVSEAKRAYNHITVSEQQPVKRAKKAPAQQQLADQAPRVEQPAEEQEVPLAELRQQLWQMVKQLAEWQGEQPTSLLNQVTSGTSLRDCTREQASEWLDKVNPTFWEESAKRAPKEPA